MRSPSKDDNMTEFQYEISPFAASKFGIKQNARTVSIPRSLATQLVMAKSPRQYSFSILNPFTLHTLFIGRTAVSCTGYRQGLNCWEKRVLPSSNTALTTQPPHNLCFFIIGTLRRATRLSHLPESCLVLLCYLMFCLIVILNLLSMFVFE
jgi:hypothetical protein